MLAALYAPVTDEMFLAVARPRRRAQRRRHRGQCRSQSRWREIRRAETLSRQAHRASIRASGPSPRCSRWRCASRASRSGSLDAALASPGSHDWDLAAADLAGARSRRVVHRFCRPAAALRCAACRAGRAACRRFRPPWRSARPGARPQRRVCIKPACSLIHGTIFVPISSNRTRPHGPGARAEQVLMPSFKRIVASPVFQGAVATAGAWYLRLAWYSSRVIFEPPNVYEGVRTPAIVAMWHGQHFLMPFVEKERGQPSRQGAHLAPSRRRDQCARGREIGHRDDPRLRRA